MVWTKEYTKEYQKRYRAENIDKVRKYHQEYQKKWRMKNPTYSLEKDRMYQRKRRQENYQEYREYARKYQREWYKKNPQYKIACSLRVRLRKALKGKIKTGSAVKLLGVSLEAAQLFLESKFLPGMSWSNHGEWHIDHIRPLVSFDLTNKEELAQACHISNLQPLWAQENLRKSARYKFICIDSNPNGGAEESLSNSLAAP